MTHDMYIRDNTTFYFNFEKIRDNLENIYQNGCTVEDTILLQEDTPVIRFVEDGINIRNYIMKHKQDESFFGKYFHI